jgi:hypothetical protein
VVFNPQENRCPVEIAEMELTPVTDAGGLIDEIDPIPN